MAFTPSSSTTLTDSAAWETPTPYDTSLSTSIASLPPKPVVDRKANWRFGTICATTESKDQYGASSVPIYQTATFKGLNGEFDYTRSGNPTRTALETQLARMYQCSRSFAVSTGMTALDVLLRLVSPGEIVIAGDDIYGGTDRLLTYLKRSGGVEVVHIDMTSPESLAKALKEGGTRVKMVLVESPTNPLLKIADIQGISEAVHGSSPEALIVVDNTMMSPYLQRPLNLGADVVYDSGTKYLSGHHDLMAGIIAVEREDVGKRIAFMINSIGSGLAPQDCFLLLRGLKTLAIRLDRQSTSAILVAAYLSTLGFPVNFPGLPNHPGRALHYKQADGAGAVLSFTTGSVGESERVVGGTRLWGISVSFGCVNSLISMPCVMSHASISADKRAERGLPEDLIRLCVGIEDPRDLIDDLEHSLLEAGAIYPIASSSSVPATPTSALSQHGEPSEAWVVERARRFARPGQSVGSSGAGIAAGVGAIVDGVKEKLGIQVAGKDVEEDEQILVSAPGKVILFGEHAVVYGATAIAAAINLRCYALLNRRRDGKIGVDLPDIGLVREFDIEGLPWKEVEGVFAGLRDAPKELDVGAMGALERYLGQDGLEHSAHVAAMAILYLYMALASDGVKPSFTFCARSTLPIGAGLGSSASYSTCVAACLLLLHSKIQVPSTSAASSERVSFAPSHTDLIDRWAFLAEKIGHGNPSGIDNAVSVRGGAVTFARAINGQKGGMEGLNGFQSIRFLLTDTKVPRNTKAMVAGVAAKLVEDPASVKKSISEIQTISEQAALALGDRSLSRQHLMGTLSSLVNDNHGHLVDLGVSHQTLEVVRAKTSAAPYSLATKLTGAGGGGCAVTLIPDDFPQQHLQDLMDELEMDGFKTYLTSIGGHGLGVLRSAVKPTDSIAPGAGETSHVPARAMFQDIHISGLEEWAENSGEWVHT